MVKVDTVTVLEEVTESPTFPQTSSMMCTSQATH